MLLPLTGEAKSLPFLQTSFDEYGGQCSPDGRWLAYVSNESDQYEIYIASFPGSGKKYRVSAQGGGNPRWRRDGKALLYVDSFKRIMSAEIREP